MKNTGVLFANDAVRERAGAIVGNVHRLGITNTVISVQDGRKFAKVDSKFLTYQITNLNDKLLVI